MAVKRSKTIRLILLGGLSAGALAGCKQRPSISTENVYTNNFYVPGAGYYHAPFRNWYPLPYNHFDAQKNLYYFGGQWSTRPFESITNISAPTVQAVQIAEESRTDIARGGFGGYSSGHYWGGSSWSGFSS